MNYKLLMDIALLAGEIMLTSGAETYRVEDTMCRILRISNLERTEAFVTTTGIFATLDDISIDAITLVKRVSIRSTNLNLIYLVNDISRKLCNDEIDWVTAYQELKNINRKEHYPDILIWIMTVATSAFFSVVLGGDWKDCAISAVNGLFIVLWMMIAKKTEMSQFIVNMMASVLIAINTMIYVNFTGNHANNEIIIAGSIMPMVPGVAITNAVRDTLQGDYMSGATRAMEAFLIAASIAVGIGVGLALYSNGIGGSLL
ncbi:uncharacterized membrane protein YjjP (DUF1212 family) [Mobilisporobacter senegalensis]|uniref:Uncharacterized membrane protein YjjP (DUF1212 family) n=1 Tax=Mobilisporobacter senegalensis TaxID=1329262 RepID=A0A3N1XW93_9FIRM|nr:threonine/serine exporter family protein [Mobilisporobacter senegalensis]ROR30548.1 uncharacterized membrane protein YjjP (DUF1212 family) [Mobilisporobacter senegalensis]